MRKYFVLLFIFLTYAITSVGQGCTGTCTNVTATLTDSQGTVWQNALWTVELLPPFGNSSPLTNGGHTPGGPQSGFTDINGMFNVILDTNTTMTPSGSLWKFTVCPNATTNSCTSSYQVVTGTNQDLSSSISNDLIPISVTSVNNISRAYSDVELSSPQQGQIYWRVSDNHLRGYTGSAWADITGAGGGGISSYSQLTDPTTNKSFNMSNFTTSYNFGASTGTLGAMFAITDGINNLGTNYLFQISTGTNSAAKAFSVCDNGTVNCVEFNGSAVFQALGGAQIIATQLINTGLGVGAVTLGSNASGSVSGLNTVKITGNTNKLYASENTASLAKVLLGGQISTSGTNNAVSSIDINGVVTTTQTPQMYAITGSLISNAHWVRGTQNLAAGTAAVSFSSLAVFTNTPVCAVSDQTAIQPVQVIPSTTGLTLNGTGADNIAYLCFGLN